MTCSKCGQHCADDMSFCPHCGEPLVSRPTESGENPQHSAGGQIPAPPPLPMYHYGQQFYAQHPSQLPNGYPAPGMYPAGQSNSALSVIKSIASSPLFLAAVILFALAQIFGLVSEFLPSSSISDVMAPYYDMMDAETIEIFDSFAESARMGSAVGTILPNLLIALGIFLIYLSAKNGTNERISTAGLTIINIITIIRLVLLSIAAVMLLLCFIIIATVGTLTDPEAAVEGVAVLSVIMLMLAAIFAFVIVYDALIIKTLGTIKKTAMSGIPSDKVSMFVAVICFMGGGFTALSAFANILHPLPFFYYLCSGISTVIFGVIIVKYRSEMRALMPPPRPFYPFQNVGGYAQTPTAPGIVTCPRCGSQYSSAYSACPHCGTPKYPQ